MEIVREKLEKLLEEVLEENELSLECDTEVCEGCLLKLSPTLDCISEKFVDDLIQKGVTIQEWVKTSERPPTKEDGDKRGCVLAWNSIREYASSKTWHYVNMRPDIFTRWMPLPQPPKEVE